MYVLQESFFEPDKPLNYDIGLFACSFTPFSVVAENVVTDGLMDEHTHKPSTVTLAVHARRRI